MPLPPPSATAQEPILHNVRAGPARRVTAAGRMRAGSTRAMNDARNIRPPGLACSCAPAPGLPDSVADQPPEASPHALLRLDTLDAQDMTHALTYLAEYSPATFDTILDTLGPADHTPDDANEEPFCATCGAPLGIFVTDGPYYRHYHETEDGDHHRYTVDHPTTLAWRQAATP
jgi:hypothetical protein